MASIRKRGSRYQLRYRDRTGAETSESFARRRDAEHRKSEVEVELRMGTFISPREARVMFGEWYQRWEAARHVSAARAAVDASRRDLHVLPRWAGIPLDAITHMELQAWVADLARKMSPASVSECFRLVKMPLDAAVRDGKLRSSPALGVSLPRAPRRRQAHEDVLTAEELSQLVAELPERWRALIFTCGWLGLRWSEALGLRLRDFNPLKGTLHIGNVVVLEVGGHIVVKEGGKTDAAARVVPLPPALAERLSAHVERYRASAQRDDFLFVTEAGTPPLRSNFTRRVLNPALRRAGLAGRRITLRQLRHTGASLMLDADLPIQDVQQRLGHSRPSTTYDVYAHLLRRRQEAGTAALDAAIRNATGA